MTRRKRVEGFGYNGLMLPEIPSPVTSLGPLSIPTFTLFIALAVFFYLAVSVTLNRNRIPPAVIFETAVFVLPLAIVGARLGHVGLHWSYFSEHTAEIFQLRQGGLNWHGALFGGGVGLLLGSRVPRWRAYLPDHSLVAISLTFPPFTFAAWRACRFAFCAYGNELDTLLGRPAWLADWSADIYTRILPRYNTSSMGSLLAVVMFTVGFILYRRKVKPGLLLYTQIMLLSAGMWIIGHFRGDPLPILVGQRADQWLDWLIFAIAALALLRDTMRLRRAADLEQELEESACQISTSS